MERARPLLDDDLLVGERRHPLVDRDRVAPHSSASAGILRCQSPASEFGPATTLKAVVVYTMGIRLARAAFRSSCTAGMMVSMSSQENAGRPGPGVGEIDVDERGSGAVADPALESPARVDFRIRREERLESGFQVIVHAEPS